MTRTRRIYRLSPSQLSAETIAVTFARTSRSPKAFDEIAAELNEEKSSQFSQKWIVGYGHASVAEHAVLHIAMENVSRLAIETIESNRLASYTEKSTRYQKWDPDAYVVPEEISGSEHEIIYTQTLEMLFDTYLKVLPILRQLSESVTPRRSGESEKAWFTRSRTAAIDVCRFLLPAASMANVGLTMNARTLEYAIRKMLSSPLAEVREIGAQVKSVAMQELPTLVKYATPMGHLNGIQSMYSAVAGHQPVGSDAWCQLLEYDPQGEVKVLAALLYRFGHGSYQDYLTQVENLSEGERVSLVAALFKETGNFNMPLRELEYTGYVFDVIMDQGAYFEFKRHRMMSQTVQPLTPYLGFAVPKWFSQAGIEGLYVNAMRQAASAYDRIAAWNPTVASYLVPNSFNRRVLFALNMRELFHFSRLRCNPNAHFSIRRIGRALIEQINPVHPLFTTHLCVDSDETSKDITQTYFTSVALH